MEADYTIVAGDTEPLLTDNLTYSNKQPVNLTNATVSLTLRGATSATPLKLSGPVLVTEPTNGGIQYEPAVTDTAIPGYYQGSWRVTFPDGNTMTFPSVGFLTVEIQPSLNVTSEATIIGLPEAKAHLFIPANDRTKDDMLTRMIQAVGPLIENITGPLTARTYDEWYEGGHSTISLRHKPSYGPGTTPIFQLLAVSEYRGPIEYDLAIVGTPTQGSVYSVMAHPELGTIVRRTAGGGTYSFWYDPSHPQQSVHVVYRVGQETVPANVREAALETIRWWYSTTEAVGRGSLTQADQEIPRPMVALPYHAIAMLEPSRRHPSIA